MVVVMRRLWCSLEVVPAMGWQRWLSGSSGYLAAAGGVSGDNSGEGGVGVGGRGGSRGVGVGGGGAKPKKGQNRIKTGQKQEAWRSREMSEAVAVDRGRKTKQNAKRMA
nr:hypothetical protein [Tanacetum cinerariifolium]